jgi:antitoxin (DNA-binding transcriptional repressor) of toxin-antitoxin stability system
LSELARQVEGGKTIVVTRHGEPVFDLVPHRPRAGLNFDAIADFKRRRSVSAVATYVAEDFDAPLPEDVLLNPMPPRS